MKLSEKIVKEWIDFQPPLDLGIESDYLECVNVAKWLSGKDFITVSNDGPQMSSELPFLCLNAESAAYYIASYMLRIQRSIESGDTTNLRSDFCLIHFIYFISSDLGVSIALDYLNSTQRNLLNFLLLEILESNNLGLTLEEWRSMALSYDRIAG